MIWDILEAKQTRRKLWEQMKQLNEKVGAENRSFTAEEIEQWGKMEKDLDEQTARIERQEKLLSAEDKATEDRSIKGAMKEETKTEEKNEDYDKAFRNWLVGGSEALSPEQRNMLQLKYVASENRNLGTTPGSAGGFLVPTGLYNRIIEAVRSVGGIRDSRAYILRTSGGGPLNIPTVDDTANVGQLIAENTQLTDLAITFGQRPLGSFLYSSRMIRVSLQLMQDSAFDIEDYLAGAIGTRIGRITNAHFTTGTGSGQPRGVVTDASSGVVAAAGNTTAITYANLVALEHSLDPGYRRGAEFMFHDSTLRAIKQLLDTTGRPLWVPGVAVREPDTILGHRYVVNQDMAVMAANARSILFGDFSSFFVRDVQDVQIMRLTERYADFLQVGFTGFSRHDSILSDVTAVRFYQNSAT